MVIPKAKGTSPVQIQRTIHRGRYRDIANGEQTILAQYIAALRAAREAIYIENQYVEVPEIVAELDAALARGVEVVLLLPAVPDHAPTAYDAPDRRAFFEARAALARYPNFTLAGIAGQAGDGRRTPVYVHSKLAIVDDAWATVGSCNLHRFSLFGNGEINAAIWCPRTAKAMRVALFREHLDNDTSALGGRDALQAFRSAAEDNRRKLARGEWNWQGLAFSLDVATYGKGHAQLPIG
jgi:phosphatidylserine/phosphatidylglycerophosphate/cardiolipin synthase-like enzyme